MDDWFAWLEKSYEFIATSLVLLLNVGGWGIGLVVLVLVVAYRHVWWRWLRKVLRKSKQEEHIDPEVLPEDISGTALLQWEQGQVEASLSLLYRGMVARLNRRYPGELQPGATEADCIRVVTAHEPLEIAAYCKELAYTWRQAAYAGTLPHEEDFLRLCQDWVRYFSAR